MREMNGGGSNMGGFLMGALVGAVVGAGVSLLLAPRTGKDTREWLSTRTKEIKDKTASALQQGREAIRRESSELADEVSSYAGSGSAKMRT